MNDDLAGAVEEAELFAGEVGGTVLQPAGFVGHADADQGTAGALGRVDERRGDYGGCGGAPRSGDGAFSFGDGFVVENDAYALPWQIREIDRVLSEAGSDADDLNFELLSHISPIGWDNVLLYGEYQLNRSLVRSERLSV